MYINLRLNKSFFILKMFLLLRVFYDLNIKTNLELNFCIYKLSTKLLPFGDFPPYTEFNKKCIYALEIC